MKLKDDKKAKAEKPKPKPMPTHAPEKYELDNKTFEAWMSQLSSEEATRQLAAFKADKKFYSKVLEEPYRENKLTYSLTTKT